MSRNHAVVQFTIWRDAEFRSLPADAQWAYLMLLSQPHVSQAGTMQLMPGKWAKGCTEMTPGRLSAALDALQTARFVFFDADTEEALIRSFIRNDGVLRQPNVLKSAIKSAMLLESTRLREVMRFELQRIVTEVSRPDVIAVLAEAIAELAPSEVPVTLPEPSANPSGTLPQPEPFANPSLTPREPHGEGEGEGEAVKVTVSSGSLFVATTSRSNDSTTTKTRPARGKRIDEAFMPTDATVARIREQFPNVDQATIRVAHESFVDYWTGESGARAAKADWDATWRNWMRREFGAGGSAPARRGGPKPAGPTNLERKLATGELLKDNPDPRILAQGGLIAEATAAQVRRNAASPHQSSTSAHQSLTAATRAPHDPTLDLLEITA